MKKSLIVIAAAVLVAGCDRQRQASNDNSTSTSADKGEIRDSVREAKSEVEKQAKAQKDILDAEAKAAQAKIDAERARAKAASVDAQAKVDAASQTIREAAGSASAKAESEVGAVKSITTAPPAEPTTTPATPVPVPPPSPLTADSDQKVVEQVRIAVIGPTADANAETAKNIQITASGGTVTLKGTVKTEAEKSQAEEKTKSVAGVTKVDNQLQVKAE